MPRPKQFDRTIKVRLPEGQYLALSHEAKALGVPFADLLRAVLDKHINTNHRRRAS